jgi:hypothetical protein
VVEVAELKSITRVVVIGSTRGSVMKQKSIALLTAILKNEFISILSAFGTLAYCHSFIIVIM